MPRFVKKEQEIRVLCYFYSFYKRMDWVWVGEGWVYAQIKRCLSF